MNRAIPILTVAALSAGDALAEATYCYEADKVDVSARTPWSHHHLVLRTDDPLTGPDGRVFRGLRGYGHNDAPTPKGSTDLVPISGAAVRDWDGSWIVSFTGTLMQTSTLSVLESDRQYHYWLITQNWVLDRTATEGIGHYGNLTRPFRGGERAGPADDSVPIDVWRVSCETGGAA